MRKLLIFSLLAVLIVVPPSSAEGSLSLNEAIVLIDISEDYGQEQITLHYVVLGDWDNAPQDSITVPGILSEVTVYDNAGVLDYTVEKLDDGFTSVSFSFRSADISGAVMITVEFIKLTENMPEATSYAIGYQWGAVPINYNVTAILPVEYTLYGYPTDSLITEDSEGNLRMRWSGSSTAEFQSSIRFIGGSGLPATPSTNSVDESVVYFSMFASAGVTGVAVFLFMRMKPSIFTGSGKSKEILGRDAERIFRMLTTHEQKVIAELMKEDNLTQRATCDRTGIPKATMSRVLQRLEKKGIVRREGIGASKRVILTNWAKRWKIKLS